MKSETKKLIQFDWAIKTLLRRRANFPILAGFLSELLNTDVTIESLLESESNKNHAKDKSSRVDIFAKLGNGELVIIEVQCERQWDFLSRILYGVSKVIVDHIKEGERYGKIPRVISVNIIYFDLGHGEDYIYRGTTQFKGIHKKDTLQLSEKEKEHYPTNVDQLSHIFPEYYVLKVSGFNLHVRNTLDEWIYALKESEVKPEFKARGICEAAQVLTRLNLSEEERYAYDRYMEDVKISLSTLDSVFSDGRAEGKAEGIVEEKTKIIFNMHRSGLSTKQISEFVELSEKQVEAILAV